MLSDICQAANGTACISDYQCESNFCNIPVGETVGTCSPCSSMGDCGGNTCIANTCPTAPAPVGGYCKADIYCEAGLICTGFPRQCTKP
jgi:hypothetical protein